MAWIKAFGTPASGKYIYKNGTVNTTLTGGLSASGYSIQGGIGIAGNNATFNANDITMSANNVQYNGCILGTNIAVDVTDLTTITMKCTYNNVDYTLNANVSALTGSKYVGFGAEWEPAGVSIFLAIAGTKTTIVQNNEALGNTIATYGNYVGLKVTEITLS